uniref:Cystathionine gamma-synthase n=1 Tax=Mucochytrium quahogii TaxID=96639 RepID=A0A7S2SMQ1_9STRA|mmetsp:Transcript_20698/g.33715  ORF Transcript_20698/g.33715 Transcript_20698/m.33715 type:complete len:913 (-) Transcript_20698:13-2751(-)
MRYSSKRTLLAGFCGRGGDRFGSANVPIYQTATFDCRSQNAYDYTRSGNPTRNELEFLCKELENGVGSFAFTSGMAGLSAVTRLVGPGQTIVACSDIYGGMHRLLKSLRGVDVRFVDTWDLPKVEQVFDELGGGVGMVCLESPTNPQMRTSDIREISRIARSHNAYVSVDNSLMSPILMNPLDLGADLCVHSGTKFLSGHSDVMAGVVVCKDEETSDRIGFVQNAEGSGLAPFDSWLLLRGMKTLALRVEEAERNALSLYDYLLSHPAVVGVNYLAPLDWRPIDSHMEDTKRSLRNPSWKEEAALHFSQSRGGGSVLSFEMANPDISKRVVANCKLFKNTVSFGSTSSLMEVPADMSHASIPREQQTLSPALIRVSVGIENVSDLLYDLGQAIASAVDDVDTEQVVLGALPLGQSLPQYDDHAVGVSMPLWSDVENYERGDAATHAKLMAGYPRFVFLKSVRQLFSKCKELFAKEGEDVIVLPSARVALRFQQYLGDGQIHDCFADGVFAITFPESLSPKAKLFWQHTGEIISSRQAATVLEIIDRTCYENARSTSSILVEKQQFKGHREELRKRIGSLCHEDPDNVFLYPTGMAAITAVQRVLKLASQWDEKPLRTVIFGFPYLDTLKLGKLPGLGSESVFLGHGDDADFEKLITILKQERIGGLFCEFPSNPLLIAPDLDRLRRLADEYSFPLIVDDSISGCCNVNLCVPGGADIVVSSLTKQFSGSGNVMGGSLLLNSHGSFFNLLRSRLIRDHENLLWEEDCQVILKASADLEVRVSQSNRSASALVEHLAQHPSVEKVYHPSVVERERYDRFKRDAPYAGYGALFSILFKNQDHSAQFFDNLDISKTPGFGQNFSLACPYTMIAHYNELDWAKEYGVDPSLVRIWVGQEDQRTLVSKFDVALDHLTI